jgi:hypothetical protein
MLKDSLRILSGVKPIRGQQASNGAVSTNIKRTKNRHHEIEKAVEEVEEAVFGGARSASQPDQRVPVHAIYLALAASVCRVLPIPYLLTSLS